MGAVVLETSTIEEACEHLNGHGERGDEGWSTRWCRSAWFWDALVSATCLLIQDRNRRFLLQARTGDPGHAEAVVDTPTEMEKRRL